jgi:hypothetical protein
LSLVYAHQKLCCYKDHLLQDVLLKQISKAYISLSWEPARVTGAESRLRHQ